MKPRAKRLPRLQKGAYTPEEGGIEQSLEQQRLAPLRAVRVPLTEIQRLVDKGMVPVRGR